MTSTRVAPRAVVAAVLLICAAAAPVQALPIDPQPSSGGVTGIVADDSGAPVAAATLTLTAADNSRIEGAAGADGRFSFAGVPAGPFTLAVAAPGFAGQTISGRVAAGETATLAGIRLRLAVHAEAIEVTPSVVEIADQQIKEQEQQRVLGIVPNFYVSFLPDAAPLNPRQKFRLSWKSRTDPVELAFVGVAAGIQQARNDFPGFGGGASGYAKRYAAAYAAGWTRSLISRVLMPTVFRQDPRYFYKGTGTVPARLAYALSRSVVRKGDNGRWQPNYSGILGSLASGAISNFYYPKEDRHGARLTLENTALGIAGGAVGHVAQEFLYARLTSRAHKRDRP